jgi:flavorubredoxin
MSANLTTSNTKVDEIADGIYRISTPVDALPGGFTFNQFLIEDDEPLLSDECGALNEFLAAAPRAVPVCSHVAAMVSVNDLADKPARALADGESLTLGRHVVEWYDTPHLPHSWECGFLGDKTTRTLFCGDLFTQGGAHPKALTEDDILGPSEAMRAPMDYFSHTKNARALIGRLARTKPTTLACMHGSSWRGDGEKLLLALGDALDR